MTTSVQRRYPVRYWVTLIFFLGMPNFVHFDPTGLTHKYGLFNLSSISDIVYTLVATAMLVILTALSREGLLTRRVNFDAGIWIVLLVSVTLATVLQPESKFVAPKPTDIVLSLYRIGQWVLGTLLLLSLYSRASEEEAPRMLAQLVARLCWASLIIIWVMAPIVPSLAYVSEDAAANAMPRLGGIMIHPSMIALAASIAFLHSMLFLRSIRRVAGCLFSLLSLALTYTRSAQIVFVFAVVLYALFISRSRAVRWLGVGSVCMALVGGVVLHGRVQQYLSRGQSQADVDSLGGRSATWQAGMRAFAERPLLGYGYIAGPKNALRDVWHEAHWIPPHAHNDFVQALLSGGIVTGVIVVWLYLYTFWVGCRRARTSVEATFFLLIFVQLLVTAMVSTNLTTGFGKPALFFVAAYLVLVSERHRVPLAKKSMPLARQPTLRWKLPARATT